jgi:D-glycerate 3-kinase
MSSCPPFDGRDPQDRSQNHHPQDFRPLIIPLAQALGVQPGSRQIPRSWTSQQRENLRSLTVADRNFCQAFAIDPDLDFQDPRKGLAFVEQQLAFFQHHGQDLEAFLQGLFPQRKQPSDDQTQRPDPGGNESQQPWTQPTGEQPSPAKPRAGTPSPPASQSREIPGVMGEANPYGNVRVAQGKSEGAANDNPKDNPNPLAWSEGITQKTTDQPWDHGQQKPRDFPRDSLGSNPGETWAVTLWRWWLPLAWRIHNQRLCSLPQKGLGAWIQGILGVQGTGKTTLTLILTWLLNRWGASVISLSLDDFYHTHKYREGLRQEDPRLRWRGPPGTHDLALALEVVGQLRRSQGDPGDPASWVALPRFDKALQQGSGDRVAPHYTHRVDIVLLEGWCVGMRPLPPDQFQAGLAQWLAPAAWDFARVCHDRLLDYVPLWDTLDDLVILRPQDYRLSQRWRTEAEAQLRQEGRGGMTDEAVAAFVEYFWQALHPEIFLPPLVESGRASVVAEVTGDRSVGSITPGGTVPLPP